MKRILLDALFVATSFSAFADAPGGAGCGQGNMLSKDQHDVATHVVATTTNGTSGSNTFGITTGTNGCHASGALSYGDKPPLVLSSAVDKLSEDTAKDNGEALITCTAVLGVQPQDREYLAAVTHKHFPEIFNESDVIAADVYVNTQMIPEQDAHLARYVEQA